MEKSMVKLMAVNIQEKSIVISVVTDRMGSLQTWLNLGALMEELGKG